MAEKFSGKYRIPSARMPNWDYGSNAAYFITICTQNRDQIFGIIENGEMILNEIGKNAETCLIEIPVHFPFVELGAFVVMPNHVHAIIVINKPVNPVVKTNEKTMNVKTDVVDGMMDVDETVDGMMDLDETVDGMMDLDETVDGIVETQDFASLQSSKKPFNKFGPQSKNLASIVRGYKIGVTKFAKIIHPGFAWQPGYYDHIIRNSISLERIQNYIYKNPINWTNEKFKK